MEAAALYALARAAKRPVLGLAHVTNTTAVAEQAFEKSEAMERSMRRILEAIATALGGK
jgi:purine-nucleoside phosphorylase